MHKLRVVSALACVAGALLFASAANAQVGKVLVFHGTSGDPHASTDEAVAAIEELGQENDFGVDASTDPADFTGENLSQYRAIVFVHSAGDVFSPEQETALRNYVQRGGGVVSIGEAAELEPDSNFIDGLIGARPADDSSDEVTTRTVAVGDRVHPATESLPLEWERDDAWYTWEANPTGQVHTLARVRSGEIAGDGLNQSVDRPISWCRDYEGGRSFFTGMGRTEQSYAQPNMREHLLGGIMWAAGLVRGGCKATINSNYQSTRLSDANDGGLDHNGESHGLVVAPNGWVIYIGRADCRTNEERGAAAGTDPTDRIFDHGNPNVAVGCGTVHVWDPEEANGELNSGITRAATLAVYGDLGTGSERVNEENHKSEAGLLGITLAPDFIDTGHIYLMYVPTMNPDSTPPGLEDGAERRITKMGKVRISRFTLDFETKQLDLDSEVRIFEYETQLWSCCHRGGGMGFDSEGNLYITTGDSNSSQGTSGTSGNNSPPTCPTGDPDEASNEHCGDNAVSYQDARRTAGSTNDYNGKLLRIKPIASIPDGEQPPIGIGSTYEIPGPNAPNGPNLFDGTEGNGNQTKPEIFAMGLRNPARLAIDPQTDIPYTAWVGPDAGAPNGQLGPSSFEVAAQISEAGNYGWPYCADGRQAYRDRTSNGEVRTENGPGYVSGGPDGSVPGWYDCDNLINDSIRNTGLTVLPHETGTGMDAGTAKQANVWYGRGNPGGANGCPVFPREGGPNSAPNYAAQPTALCPYITASGATVMSGPVYRYDESAGSDSVRWPEYWDGRWFLHDFSGGQSVRHGLLLDPETADEGGQPVYADNMKQIITWSNGNYMDSKFGPDGALYVQLYGPYFRVGDGNGIYRVAYVGGPDTPGADPQWEATGNPREVEFSIGASGGVSYAWDFDGDGNADSTEPNPTHTFADDGQHEVTLTVTYADGEEDSKTVAVNVSGDDTAPPETTATLSPAEPGPGGTYDGPVEVTLEATDNGGSGVELIQYRINSGPWQAYEEPFTVRGDGHYVIDYRARDAAGNVEEPKSVEFTIETAPGEGCSQSDEFDGSELDPKWEIRNDNPELRSVSDGALHLTTAPGDVRGAEITAQNTLLQQVPAGAWTATLKLDHTAIEANGQAAGIAMLASENPGYLAKTAVQYKANDLDGQPMNGIWVERVLTTDSSDNPNYGWPGKTGPQYPNSGKIEPPTDDLWIRVRFDGTEIHTEYSLDGEEWEASAPPFPASEFGPDGLEKVGVFAKHDGGGPETTVDFDWFRVEAASCGDGDAAPPNTTATLDPAQPTGENGWYVDPVEVTLTAEDDEGGSGVASTEYRIDGGEWQAYSEPFVVASNGRHVVEYRSTDNEGNVESPERLDLAIDLSAPATTATQSGSGPVEVTLSADDGNGSGVAKTEFRVDGGEWKEYVTEQPILDQESDLENWKMAGPGSFVWNDAEGGYFRTQGGLGMLWYPVREYGDFSLKMQWRDVSEGANGNSGVLIRFPNPEEAVQLPPDERHDCQVGSGQTSPAWVAIYCGHEIQINDHQGDVQKTGSVYNFDPVLDPDHRGQPKGTWVDYEIRVEGQKYTIIRNGEVLNEFENTPGQQSSREGDPPTDDRQFDSGYIGLQNHGTADVIDFRHVRVLPLGEGTVEGPIVVEGDGRHTVEFRSTDQAGNVEDTKSIQLQIGDGDGGPGSPPPGGGGGDGSGDDRPSGPPTVDLAKPSRKETKLNRFLRRGIQVSASCQPGSDGTMALEVKRGLARKLGLRKRTTLAKRAVRCGSNGQLTTVLKPSGKVKRALKSFLKDGGGSLKVRLRLRMSGPAGTASDTTKVVLKGKRKGKA